jgi:hypothetical protein
MIHGFADDTVMEQVVVCAAVIFDEERIADAEVALADAKASVGIDPGEPLHCRVLFSGDARRGTVWERVSRSAIDAMVEKLCLDLRPFQHRPVVAPIKRREFPDQQMEPGGPVKRLDIKGIASFAYHAIIVNLHGRFGHERFRLWIDPDKTMTPWGATRRRVDTTRRIYVDLGPGQEPPLIEPVVDDQPKPVLLQVADLYAYITGRGLSAGGGRDYAWFRKRLAELDPESMWFRPEANTQWENA